MEQARQQAGDGREEAARLRGQVDATEAQRAELASGVGGAPGVDGWVMLATERCGVVGKV